jgi:hypothetical protein
MSFLAMYSAVQTRAQFYADVFSGVALLLELCEVVSLAGAVEEVFLPWTATKFSSMVCLVSMGGALWASPLKLSSADL